MLFGERDNNEQEFMAAASRGPLLLVRGHSSNGFLKGRFQVGIVDAAGNIQAEHLE